MSGTNHVGCVNFTPYKGRGQEYTQGLNQLSLFLCVVNYWFNWWFVPSQRMFSLCFAAENHGMRKTLLRRRRTILWNAYLSLKGWRVDYVKKKLCNPRFSISKICVLLRVLRLRGRCRIYTLPFVYIIIHSGSQSSVPKRFGIDDSRVLLTRIQNLAIRMRVELSTTNTPRTNGDPGHLSVYILGR